MKVLTFKEANALVHADPSGEGSVAGVLVKLSALESRLGALEGKKAPAVVKIKKAKAPASAQAPAPAA